MGDAEFMTRTECAIQHRDTDNKINAVANELRQESKDDLQKVYDKLDRLFYAGAGLIVTSLISIALTLFSLLWNSKPS
jgi:hypothetical protein